MNGLPIDKSEVLRYLGWRGQELDSPLKQLISEEIDHCRKISRPRSVRRLFPIRFGEEGVQIGDTGLLLPGAAIRAHLHGADLVALTACTLGHEIDGAIRAASLTDMTRAALLDAAASAMIESYCDAVEGEVRGEAAARGLFIGSRFSPGYGDLPIGVQGAFLAALDAGRAIGLTVSEANLMIPCKSVTAIIGLFRTPDTCKGNGCMACDRRKDCIYKKE